MVEESQGDIFYADKRESDNETFMDWHGPGTDAVGSGGFISSRLIQVENLATEEAKSALLEAILLSGGGLFNHVGGKGVIEGDPHGETSVSPAWRQTVSHYVLANAEQAPLTGSVDEFERAMKAATDLMQPLRDITSNSGAYWNEADMNEPNWEHTFWGDNYAALKEIKQKYDPHRMFRVWNGVGGTRPETGSQTTEF